MNGHFIGARIEPSASFRRPSNFIEAKDKMLKVIDDMVYIVMARENIIRFRHTIL
jgi:hypothetical protein